MRIAITGGIAEGKSTVLRMLADLGFAVASSDEFARTVFQSEDVQSELRSLLGAQEPVTRDLIRAAIQSSAEIRRSVNRIMHPRIRHLNENSDATFFEVPLLIETCLQGKYDRVWVVTCGQAEQERRLRVRYGPELSFEKLVATQVSARVRLAFADRIFRTNEPVDAVLQSLSAAVADTLG